MAQEHILVVEDEEDIQELIKYNLEREGYRVTVVGTGEDALRAAAEEKPNLILLDLMLPAMNGLDVCRSIKNNHEQQGTPVIMVSRGEKKQMWSLGLNSELMTTSPNLSAQES